jgi:hypothetical protein
VIGEAHVVDHHGAKACPPHLSLEQHHELARASVIIFLCIFG